MKTQNLYLVAVCVLSLAGSVEGGTNVDVPSFGDPGFEDHVVVTEIPIKDSSITAWDTQSITAYPDIRKEGYYGPAQSHGGDQHCYLGGQTVFQNVSDTYVAGVTYTFSYYAYNNYSDGSTVLKTWNYFTDGVGIGQYGGTTLGGAGGVTVSNQQEWVLITSSYTATASDASKNIGIGVAGPTGLYIDDAALTYYVPGDKEIRDPGFEDHIVSTSFSIKDSTITAWDTQSTNTLPDIRKEGYYGPAQAHGGDQLCHLGGQTVFQNVLDTYVEGVVYTFSYYAYNNYSDGTTALTTWNYFTDASGTGQYGGTTLGGQGKVTVTEQQQWVLVTSSYTAKAADAGKNIGIGIAGPTAMYIDDVALTHVVPEYLGLICRGAEESGALLIGQPGFGQDLISLFVTGENPQGGTHTREQNVAWVNDPLHSYVPDGTGGLCVWANHPDISDSSPIFDLPGLAGLEVHSAGNGTFRDDLWDNVLVDCYDADRPFLWGFAVDDTHSLSPGYCNLSWYAARVPATNEFALKNALRNGAFYVSSGPAILDIAVEGDVISLDFDGQYDVLWLRDGQYVMESGDVFEETLEGGGNRCLRKDSSVSQSSLDLGDPLFAGQGIKFVRAIVWTDRSFMALTQPWRINADGSMENPYPAEGAWIRGQTHNHSNATPGEQDGARLKAFRLAYQSYGQLGSFCTDYSYREAPYQWLASDGVPQVESVDPAHVRQGEALSMVVKGTNFAAGCVVKLNTQVVSATRIGAGELEVSVPGDLPAGKYDITILNPAGFQGNRPAGLVVRHNDADTKDWTNHTVADGLAHPHNTCIVSVSNEVWVGSMWGVSHYKDGAWQVFRGEVPGDVVYDIQPTSNGGLWMSGGHDSTLGMAYRSPVGAWSTEEVGDPSGLGSTGSPLERWGYMAIDENDDSLWVANRWNRGMAVRDGSGWERLTSSGDGLPNEDPSALAFDSSGVLWAGFSAGLYQKLSGGWQKVTLPAGFASLDYSYAIEPAADGSVWVSMVGELFRGGGGVLHFLDGQIIEYTPENSPLPSDTIRDILVDSVGNVWFASDYGVAMLDTRGTWYLFTTLNSGLGCDLVQALAEDSPGQIWFATMEGVDCFNAASELAEIVGLKFVSGNVLELKVDCLFPSALYTMATASLVDGFWTAVGHSINGSDPFVETNLNYSVTSGIYRVIYLKTDDSSAFFTFGSE